MKLETAIKQAMAKLHRLEVNDGPYISIEICGHLDNGAMYVRSDGTGDWDGDEEFPDSNHRGPFYTIEELVNGLIEATEAISNPEHSDEK